MDSRRDRHVIRKALYDNGFDPLPNKSKLCVMPEWSKVEITEDLLQSEPYKKWKDTGIRCGEVIGLDLDIDDVDLLEELVDELCNNGIEESQFVRIGRAPREMWIYVTDDKVHKMTTGKFGRNLNSETEEYTDVYQVEVLGGGSQFGAYGRHSRGIEYEWPQLNLLDRDIDDLPVITKADLEKIITLSSAFFRSKDFIRVSQGLTLAGTFKQAYDLTDDMVVTTRDHGNMTIREITDTLPANRSESWRCCMDFIREDTTAETTGLINYLDGHITISDFVTGVTHFPAELGYEDAILAIRGMLIEKSIELRYKREEQLRGEPMSPYDDLETSLIKALDCFVYINADDKVADKYNPQTLLSVPGFKTKMAPYNREEPSPRGGTKITFLSSVWIQHNDRVDVEQAVFRPDMPHPIFELDGFRYLNTYQPVKFLAADGDASMGFRFIEHLLPNREECTYFLRWLSYKLQYPHVRGPGIVMVADNTYGTGRGTLFNLIDAMMTGRYTYNIDFKTLSGSTSQSQYNDWLENNLIVVVDEAKEIKQGRWKSGHDAYEHLKTVIDPASTKVHIVRKTISNGAARTFASLIICTNHIDALIIPEHDRRLAILENGVKGTPDFWDEFNAWLAKPGNVGAFTEAVLQYDLGNYNPFAEPLKTVLKREMVHQSESDIDRLLSDFLATRDGDIACFQQLETYVMIRQGEEELALPDKWETILAAMFKRATRVGTRDNLIRLEKKQLRYRIIRNFRAAAMFKPAKIIEEIRKNGPFMQRLTHTSMSNVTKVNFKAK